MALSVERITDAQADLIVTLDEGQFSDVKALDIEPAKLTKALAALANSDGGDLYIGIDEERTTKVRTWRGFSNQEAANGHLQAFEKFFPLGGGFNYKFLRCDTRARGL
jgi:ATP-dependent DNA helicase RecG